jgi:hypothetical protein
MHRWKAGLLIRTSSWLFLAVMRHHVLIVLPTIIIELIFKAPTAVVAKRQYIGQRLALAITIRCYPSVRLVLGCMHIQT